MNLRKVYALHIGINNVDLSNEFYNYANIPPLNGCINDMRNLASFLKSKLKDILTEQILLSSDSYKKELLPTGDNILKTVKRWSLGSDEQEIFIIITYSGHGTPVPDNSEDEGDNKDEAWVCYDRFLLDDELRAEFANFNSNTKILVVSDSCHSGTMIKNTNFDRVSEEKKKKVRFVPYNVANGIILHSLNRNRTTSRNVVNTSPKSGASVKLLAACEDHEYAQEVDGAGVFTTALLKTLNKYPNITFKSLMDKVKLEMNDDQNPRIENDIYGSRNFYDDEMVFGNAKVEGQDDGYDSSYGEDSPLKKIPDLSFSNNKLLINNGNNWHENSFKKEISTKINKRSLTNTKNIWDETYNYIFELNRKNSGELPKHIEPEIYSHLHWDLDVCKKNEINSRYLSTYPNPKQYDIENELTWHLTDEYSQLKKAFKEVWKTYIGKESLLKNEIQDKVCTIGHIDTGILENHPVQPLNFNKKKSKSFILYDNLSFWRKSFIDSDVPKMVDIVETQGHGNATISLLAGNKIPENGKPVYFGAHPYAEIITYKVSETVIVLSGNKVAKAIEQAVDDGCQVISISMAGLPSQQLADAVNKAYEAGVIVVAAAGNSWVSGNRSILPKTTLYPAKWERVISAIGATVSHAPYLYDFGRLTRTAGGENMQMCYGPTEKENSTAVAAYTPNTTWFGECKHIDNLYDKTGGGTSSATPQIAAAAALYLDKYRKEIEQLELKEDEKWKIVEIVKEALFGTTKEFTIPDREDWSEEMKTKYPKDLSNHFGNGIVQAYKVITDIDFSPENLIQSLVKAPKADCADKLVHKVINCYGINNKLKGLTEAALQTELAQLVNLDKAIFDFIEKSEIDEDELVNKALHKLAVLIKKSKLASNFLKKNLIDYEENDLDEDEFRSSGMIQSQKTMANVKVTTTNLSKQEINEYINEYNVFGENPNESEDSDIICLEYQTEVILENGGEGTLRNLTGAQIEVVLNRENDNEGDEFALFPHIAFVSDLDGEEEDNFVTNSKWFFEDNYTGTRGIEANINKDSFVFDVSQLVNTTRGNSNIKEQIKKVVCTIFKLNLTKLKQKIAKAGAKAFFKRKNEIRIFDLYKNKSRHKEKNKWDVLNIKHKNKQTVEYSNKYIKTINEKEHILICFHGLFSNVQDGFNEFFENREVINQFDDDKFGKIIIGCNCSDIVDGIAENVKDFIKNWNLLKLKKFNEFKSITIIAKSRGCIVARKFVEEITKGAKPANIDQLILMAPPNQGTPIAREELYEDFLNIATKLLPRKTPSAMLSIILFLAKLSVDMLKEVPNLDGIDNLEADSNFIKQLNENLSKKPDILKRTKIVITDYEPKAKALKILDDTVIDPKIFDNKWNDGVVPFHGAFFDIENDNQFDLKSKFQEFLTESEKQDGNKSEVITKLIIAELEELGHFGYLKPKIRIKGAGRRKETEHNEIVQIVAGWLGKENVA